MFPDDGHMLGDSAYPCLSYLLVPFKDNGNQSIAQKLYNKKLSKSRVIIEQTFGLLITRFRWLKFIYMNRTDLIPILIMSACILHNICIDNNDEIMCEENVETYNNLLQSNDETNYAISGVNKRNEIILNFVTQLIHNKIHLHHSIF